MIMKQSKNIKVFKIIICFFFLITLTTTFVLIKFNNKKIFTNTNEQVTIDKTNEPMLEKETSLNTDIVKEKKPKILS